MAIWQRLVTFWRGLVTSWQRLIGAERADPSDPIFSPEFDAARAQLLPCPFCDEPVFGFQLVKLRPRKVVIRCFPCDVEMDVTYQSLEIAKERWNRRYGMSEREAWEDEEFGADEPLRS